VLETVSAGDELATGVASCAEPAATTSIASTTKMIFFMQKVLVQNAGVIAQ
jgi:hypothetical protein